MHSTIWRAAVAEPDIRPRYRRRPIIAFRARQDSTERSAAADRTEATLANEPTEKADKNDPIEPIESTDPTDPIDRIEPREPIHRIESSDLIDSHELSRVFTLSIIAHLLHRQAREDVLLLFKETVFTESEIAYLASQRLGRLASAQPKGTLQVSPVRGVRGARAARR
jgi:hypothetical protein